MRHGRCRTLRGGTGWPAARAAVRGGVDDAIARVASWLGIFAERGVGGGLVLVVGDESGPATAGGSILSLVPEAARAVAVSVGVEPGEASAGVLHLGGGAATLLRLLDEQITRRRRRRVSTVDEDPAWTIRETGTDPLRHRVISAAGQRRPSRGSRHARRGCGRPVARRAGAAAAP